jgi:hypothetical protein
MTSATALIEQLRASGLTIKVIGTNEIEIEGPEAALGVIPVEDIKRHKTEIIKTLTIPPEPEPLTAEQATELIEHWLQITDNPPRSCSHVWRDLADKTSDFALGVWAYPAVTAGRGDGALFAIDEGLIPETLRRGLHLMKIDADAAAVMTRKGELELFRRPRTTQPPWWKDPRVAAHHNTPAKAVSERK